ncbi:flagellin domain protein [Clostridium sp. CAG:221]|uniref:flagellin N-terminal helical domain-containing protein n=1 Tax=Clostridium sp. CAG:221 TaxID=1262780 RepID=UPI00034064C1|nr:flagellin [Clostridium sp. CAG:221]CDB14759.1 flagellin domain protein [Clostridium sp. CAG:221]
MKINHNMGAMNSKRNMKINNKASSKSIEKLSSGLRISSAGDDVAGLSISEKMRSQIRGLEQASRNAADGITLIQTAEGALNETNSILQRMRELSVQSINDTNNESDRNAIQKEINSLTSEINRIANNTEYNTKKLLTGGDGKGIKAINLDFNGTEVTHTKGNDAVTKGMKVGVTISSNLSSSIMPQPDGFNFELKGVALSVRYVSDKANNVGHIQYANYGGVITGGNITITNTDNGTIAASDVEKVAKSTAELFQKQIDSNATLRGEFKAYNKGSQIIIEALDSNGTVSNAEMKVTGIDSSSNGLTITDVNTGNTVGNGTTIGKQDIPAKGASTTIDFSNVAATLDDIKALVDAGMSINGQTIQFYDSDDEPYKGKAIGIDIKGVTNAEQLVDAIITQTQNKLHGVELTKDGNNKLVITSTTKGEHSKLEIFNGNSYNKDIEISLQVGSNENQSMLVSIGEMTAKGLGLVGVGDGFRTVYEVDDGEGNYNVECSLDVTTAKNAQNAIGIIDEATKKVSTQRSALGAYQNRLQYVVNNLNYSAENTISSESKIRDTDMALEITKNAKSNVLLQAAQSMMAQANSAPEQIIQLLK